MVKKKCEPAKKAAETKGRIDDLLALIDTALEENDKALHGDPPRPRLRRSGGKPMGTTQSSGRLLSS